MPLFAFIDLDDLFGVDRQAFVGIDDHAEKAGIRLKKSSRKLTFFSCAAGKMSMMKAAAASFSQPSHVQTNSVGRSTLNKVKKERS